MTAQGATLTHQDLDAPERGSTATTTPRTDRLVELVTHLSDCSAPAAAAAVRAAVGPVELFDDEARLLVVARALVAIRRQRRSAAS